MQIEITIQPDGTTEVQGVGLKPGERIADVAKFLVAALGEPEKIEHRELQRIETKHHQHLEGGH